MPILSPLRLPRSLVIQTTCFHQDDWQPTKQLGQDLYEELTRPVADPLAFGTSIPVFNAVDPDRIDPKGAAKVVVVPVLGASSFLLERVTAMNKIREWHATLGPGHVLPVAVDEVWRSVEGELPGKILLTELYGEEPRRRATIMALVIAVARLLLDIPQKPVMFVSHAKSDLGPSLQAAEKIAEYAKTNTTAAAFFDRTELFSGESLDEQLNFATSRGVFIAVRGDSYSSRIWCQKELLEAKRNGVPTLTVEVLQKGERRSLAYGGNSPTIVWDRQHEDPGRVVARAMVEYLRSQHFLEEGRRAAEAAGLPEDVKILTRPPELLDMAQGPLRNGAPQLVMHPDPELSARESQLLRAANPRLRLVTPLTAYRRVLSREMGLPDDSPLNGFQVGMSLADSPDVDGPEGYTKHHLVDVTVQLSRALISAGAAIAYGGDFRNPDLTDSMRHGYTTLLAELIGAYNQTSALPAEYLHSYLPATVPLGEVPKTLPMTLHHLVHSKDVSGERAVPYPDQQVHPTALYVSDMRRVMALKTQARIAIAGQATPRLAEGGEGYGVRYPGVVEEAWRSLEVGQPLYVVGGFGGAAALVADLLEGNAIPDGLKDSTWSHSNLFMETARAIDKDPYRKKLGLPISQEAMAKLIKGMGKNLMASNEASVAWNGLTIDENKALFRSRDPLLITSLVMRGLLEVSKSKAAGRLAIELVQGSVTEGRGLDAIAVASFDDVPLGGAGAALDVLAGGRASQGRTGGRRFISVSQLGIEADWIYLATLGRVGDPVPLADRVRAAARDTAETARRHGLRRVGVVAFGGSVVGDLKAAAGAMLDGLVGELPNDSSLTWFESDDGRFDELHEILSKDPRVILTKVARSTPQVAVAAVESPLILQVRREAGGLAVTILPSTGNAVVGELRPVLSDAELKRLGEGAGNEKRNTPSLAVLDSRGLKLTTLLLGDKAEPIFEREARSKVVVVHDVASSRIPFELMTFGAAGAPAVGAGINRRLAVTGVPLEHVVARPPKLGRLDVLLVVNPTRDLGGAEKEGELVEQLLGLRNDWINLKVLRQDEATKAAVLAALPTADVLHYCGHAFYDGPGEDQSGLYLAGEEKLTLANLRGAAPPRVVIFNACEAGRVRGDVTTEAASFAEFFLRGGVEAYIGTYWRVGDAAAMAFAEEVYTELARGHTLDQAVTSGRRKLHKGKMSDWANYILYGDGHFRLLTSDV